VTDRTGHAPGDARDGRALRAGHLAAASLSSTTALYAPTIVLPRRAHPRHPSGRGAVRPAAERRFWDLWSAAFSFWLAQTLVGLATSRIGADLPSSRTGCSPAFYTSLLLAARLAPDRSDDLPPASLLRALEVVAPPCSSSASSATSPSSPSSTTVRSSPRTYRRWSSTRSSTACWSPGSPSAWRGGVAALAGPVRLARGGSGLWFLGDVLETLMSVEIVPWRPPGSPATSCGGCRSFPLLVAARLRSHPSPSTRPGGRGPRRRARRLGDPLVAYAAAFPSPTTYSQRGGPRSPDPPGPRGPRSRLSRRSRRDGGVYQRRLLR